MTELVLNPGLVRQIRLAGLFYLVIIVAGLELTRTVVTPSSLRDLQA